MITQEQRPTTLREQLLECMDENGCVSYAVATAVSRQHGLASEFVSDYGFSTDWAVGVDLGELLVWLGYWMLREGSHPPYPSCRILLFFTTPQPCMKSGIKSLMESVRLALKPFRPSMKRSEWSISTDPAVLPQDGEPLVIMVPKRYHHGSLTYRGVRYAPFDPICLGVQDSVTLTYRGIKTCKIITT